MIKKIDVTQHTLAKEIYRVFQVSYRIEADILKAENFPPLQRTVLDLQESPTAFYGFYKAGQMAAVIEVKEEKDNTHIQSLVVDPDYFRQGIGKRLMDFVMEQNTNAIYTVETGVDNEPACSLYKSLGFIEVQQWDTSFGVRKIRFKKGSNKKTPV
ncbi:GNAT family N-acetyltransferase [Aquimarina sp. 2-A2]|uniref:GNAT family N-acetyltransferase n=1 Tax=Aquimarina sp. 2-A2 TaxID=3382644 RepID=UPI00387F1E07